MTANTSAAAIRAGAAGKREGPGPLPGLPFGPPTRAAISSSSAWRPASQRAWRHRPRRPRPRASPSALASSGAAAPPAAALGRQNPSTLPSGSAMRPISPPPANGMLRTSTRPPALLGLLQLRRQVVHRQVGDRSGALDGVRADPAGAGRVDSFDLHVGRGSVLRRLPTEQLLVKAGGPLEVGALEFDVDDRTAHLPTVPSVRRHVNASCSRR